MLFCSEFVGCHLTSDPPKNAFAGADIGSRSWILPSAFGRRGDSFNFAPGRLYGAAQAVEPWALSVV